MNTQTLALAVALSIVRIRKRRAGRVTCARCTQLQEELEVTRTELGFKRKQEQGCYYSFFMHLGSCIHHKLHA